MSKLVYSEKIRTQIETFQEHLPHALLISGDPGTGTTTIALSLAGRQLASITSPTDVSGNDDLSAKGIIRVDQIHQLAQHARGRSRERRVYVIDHADRMNTRAQAAFLKLLEEPSLSVSFVLIAHETTALLPTILSRVQRLRVARLSDSDSNLLLDDLRVYDATKRQQLLYLAAGRPAEIVRLAGDDEYFSRQAAFIGVAKTMLEGQPYAKVLALQPYLQDRGQALQLLETLRTILLHSIALRPSHELITRADDVARVYQRIAANGSIRLQLMTLVV